MIAQPETPQATRPRRVKWIVGIALVASGVLGLTAWSMGSEGAVSYFATPTEVATQRPTGKALRVGGRVAPATMFRDGATVRFEVTDGVHRVPVLYTGEIPDTLKEETDVVADGLLQPDGTLLATRVLAKCSSRFVPEVEQDARKAAS